MKPRHPSILPHFLLLFLGFSTALLFFLVHEKIKPSEKMTLVEREIRLEDAQGSRNSLQSSRYSCGIGPKRPPVKRAHSVYQTPRFNLQHVRSGREQVPRIYLAHLPKNIKNQRVAKKQTFIKVLLPLILAENEHIIHERHRLITLFNQLDAGHKLSSQDRQWLYQTAQEYRVRSINRRALLSCVDVVPPSLALAQAILESGFGRSSAALRKNSVFGHMATLTRVAAFPTLPASVKAYVKNLNCHIAYKTMRDKRAQMRQEGKPLSGHHLALGLGKYSIRGKDYVQHVQRLIKHFQLDSFDNVTLQQASLPATQVQN